MQAAPQSNGLYSSLSEVRWEHGSVPPRSFCDSGLSSLGSKALGAQWGSSCPSGGEGPVGARDPGMRGLGVRNARHGRTPCNSTSAEVGGNPWVCGHRCLHWRRGCSLAQQEGDRPQGEQRLRAGCCDLEQPVFPVPVGTQEPLLDLGQQGNMGWRCGRKGERKPAHHPLTCSPLREHPYSLLASSGEPDPHLGIQGPYDLPPTSIFTTSLHQGPLPSPLSLCHAVFFPPSVRSGHQVTAHPEFHESPLPHPFPVGSSLEGQLCASFTYRWLSPLWMSPCQQGSWVPSKTKPGRPQATVGSMRRKEVGVPCVVPRPPQAVLSRSPRGAGSESRASERMTGEPCAVPKTGSLITFMSSLKSFAFPTHRRAGAGRVRRTDGRTGTGATARRAAGPGGPRALAPPRRASRRNTGSRRRACGPALLRPPRPPGARRRLRPPPPGGARRCCCGCARSAGPRRGVGRPARTRRRTTRRTRTRLRPPPRARRAGRRRRPGWRSSAGRPARSSRRGARARRWRTAPGLWRESAGASGPRWPPWSPLSPTPTRHTETRGDPQGPGDLTLLVPDPLPGYLMSHMPDTLPSPSNTSFGRSPWSPNFAGDPSVLSVSHLLPPAPSHSGPGWGPALPLSL